MDHLRETSPVPFTAFCAFRRHIADLFAQFSLDLCWILARCDIEETIGDGNDRRLNSSEAEYSKAFRNHLRSALCQVVMTERVVERPLYVVVMLGVVGLPVVHA